MKPLKHKPYTLPKLATKAPKGQWNPDGRLYYDIWLMLELEWDRACRAYEANPGDFANAWYYVDGHPAFWRLLRMHGDKGPLRHVRNLESDRGFDTVDISVHRVSPKDRRISDDPALNTRTEVWIEGGECSWSNVPADHITVGTHYHNIRLDCGAATYEKAVIRFARRVWKYYGNDRRRCEPEYREQKRVRKSVGQDTVQSQPAEPGIVPATGTQVFQAALREFTRIVGQGGPLTRSHHSYLVGLWPRPPCYWTRLGQRVHVLPSCRCRRC